MFPVPRITESFIDGVIESLGWQRYLDIRVPEPGEPNADYVSRDAVLELKIFEEEGLEKSERQAKIASLYGGDPSEGAIVDVDLDQAPEDIRQRLETLVSGPLQTAVKKASRQIKATSAAIGTGKTGVLIGVNNGYSYLNADNFERLLVRRCLNDSTNIEHVACITVDYHQGSFDAFVFCTVRCQTVRGSASWSEFEAFQTSVVDAFNDAMTQMMRDQLNPEFWAERLMLVTDIRFERNGVTYLRKAPDVPDSRYGDET